MSPAPAAAGLNSRNVMESKHNNCKGEGTVARAESIKLYKRFVNKEIPEEINKIYSRGNLPAVIGSKSFVSKIKDKFFNLDDYEDIPDTKKLAPDIDEIINHVCKAYNIDEPVLQSSRRGYFNEPRNVSIYLVRYLRNITLKETGMFFGIKKHSTVSSIVDRVQKMMKYNKTFNKRVKKLAEKISKSQGVNLFMTLFLFETGLLLQACKYSAYCQYCQRFIFPCSFN